MVMAATEDKTFRGALIAAPSMPWVWGNIAGYSGPYHLVWSRDAYQVATAMLAAGDRAGAHRAVSYLFERQQQADGCFPQNSNLDGSPHWPNLQLDEVADPIILSWQLRRFDAGTWAHVKRAADCIVDKGPVTQERWENLIGYSPASLAAEVAGLVCAAEIAKRNGDDAAAARYLEVADERQSSIEAWTLTTSGPLSNDAYYVRATIDGKPNAGTTYPTPDNGPVVDQRQVVDPSFLELARLGVKPARDKAILNTIPVVDRELGVDTPNGRFWHRFNFDGYGELPDGGPFGTPGNRGRLWPIFAGERGEYELPRPATPAPRAAGCGRWPRRQQRLADARAGVGRPAAARPRARHPDVLGNAAGVDARAARAARLVDRRRPAGRAAGGRRAALRRRLRLDRLGEQRRQVDHAHVAPTAAHAVVEHHRAERAGDGQRLGAGLGRLAHPLLVDRRAVLLHPHVRAAGAAAERLLLPPLHLDRRADGRGQLARLRAHVVVAGEVAGVVVRDRLLTRRRREPAVADQLGEQLGVVHDLVAAPEVGVLARQRVEAVRAAGDDLRHARLVERRDVPSA